MRLHDAAGGVTAETLQHVYDLVSQHVSQQTRHYGRVRRFPHAIVEKHDARPLEWHSIGKCAGMPVLRGGEGDRDHDSVPCGDAEALVISPLQPYARLRKKLCGYFPTRIDGRRVRSGIETNHHHPLGDSAIACPSTRPNCQHRCNTQKPHGVLSSCRGKRKGRRKGATLVADFVIALRWIWLLNITVEAGNNLVSGTVDAAHLDALVHSEQVTEVRAHERHHLRLNTSVPQIAADQERSGGHW